MLVPKLLAKVSLAVLWAAVPAPGQDPQAVLVNRSGAAWILRADAAAPAKAKLHFHRSDQGSALAWTVDLDANPQLDLWPGSRLAITCVEGAETVALELVQRGDRPDALRAHLSFRIAAQGREASLAGGFPAGAEAPFRFRNATPSRLCLEAEGEAEHWLFEWAWEQTHSCTIM